MASTPGSSHGKAAETAVPTLKVMRLQSPDLSQVRFCEFYVACFFVNAALIFSCCRQLRGLLIANVYLALPWHCQIHLEVRTFCCLCDFVI